MRVGLVADPAEYRWSSARARLLGRGDALVKVAPLLDMAPDWRRVLCSQVGEEELRRFREHERTILNVAKLVREVARMRAEFSKLVAEGAG
jgi:putative transposase